MFLFKDREKALRRYDFFLIFLAVASVGLIIAEERMDFTEAEEGIFGLVDTAVWLIFVADYFSRFFLAGDKKHYVKTHIIELIAILPFDALFKGLRSLRLFRMLRSTRALRILRLIRLAAYFGRAHRYASRFLRQHNFQYVLFFTVLTVLIGAAAVRYFEQMGFYDALWWAFVTATTVGYGDISPSTAGGRIVAIMLMLVGIGFISTLTGTIASFFVAPAPEPEAKPGNEFLALALRRLENFENLSTEEVREICAVLQGLKEKQ